MYCTGCPPCKNIRAESVIFFPEHVSTLQKDRYETEAEIDISEPILMGYIFSRPDDIIIWLDQPSTPQIAEDIRRPEITTFTYSYRPIYPIAEPELRCRTPRNDSIYGRNMTGRVFVPEKMKEMNIGGFTLDYYQHPAKHADPSRLYRHAYDVYSLGILLLEVGVWETLKDYNESYGDFDPDVEYVEEDHYERRRWICRNYLDRLRWACGDTYADVVLSCLMVDSSDGEVAKSSERELCARIIADLEGCQA